MVSQNQSGGTNGMPRNEAHRFLATDMALAPIVRGIEDVDRVLIWWNEVCKMDIEGERREQVLDRMQYLKERENQRS